MLDTRGQMLFSEIFIRVGGAHQKKPRPDAYWVAYMLKQRATGGQSPRNVNVSERGNIRQGKRGIVDYY